jgi:hypothetical protein
MNVRQFHKNAGSLKNAHLQIAPLYPFLVALLDPSHPSPYLLSLYLYLFPPSLSRLAHNLSKLEIAPTANCSPTISTMATAVVDANGNSKLTRRIVVALLEIVRLYGDFLAVN